MRGIKSGLPLNDAIRLIANDGQEPVKAEFRRVIEAQQLGLNIPEACARMSNVMPLPEVNFFAIVIGIQRKRAAIFPRRLATCQRFCANAAK